MEDHTTKHRMPELPEVETTRLALEPYLAGERIAELIIRRRDLRWPVPAGLEETLQGRRILHLRRIGKYMIFDIEPTSPTGRGRRAYESGEGAVATNPHPKSLTQFWPLPEGEAFSLIVHLGMSGSFRIALTAPETLKTHDHLLLKMGNGATAIYHDPRRFGFLLPCPTTTLTAHPLLAKMGADPLDKTTFTAAYLYHALRTRKTAVKLAIMDQHLIAGMGNIYASEALFMSRIHPERIANTITKKETERLIPAVTAVLRAALASGGSTLRDYVSGENTQGYFQHQFQVYDRAGAPCTACGHPVEKLTQSGRATYCCAKCQR